MTTKKFCKNHNLLEAVANCNKLLDIYNSVNITRISCQTELKVID